MRFSLIGGSGGLGAILADHLLSSGHEAITWSRSARRSLDVLDARPPAAAFECDRLIYLAWSTTDRSPNEQDRHAAAAIRWSDRAGAEEVPFVFVSTVLATRSARSEYGRAKLLAERGIRRHGGRSVRVGLVVDDGYPELLASRLRRLAQRTPWSTRIATWPVLPVAGVTAARIILAESLSEDHDAAPVLAAEREPVVTATVMSGSDDARLMPRTSSFVTLLAKRYPTSRGSIGRHVDALRGLALTRPDVEGARDAASGPIVPGDWRRGLMPSKDS